MVLKGKLLIIDVVYTVSRGDKICLKCILLFHPAAILKTRLLTQTIQDGCLSFTWWLVKSKSYQQEGLPRKTEN